MAGIAVRKLLAALLSVFAIIVCAGCGKTENRPPPVEITVFSTGKSDAILVRADDSLMLIDCGEAMDGDRLLSELEKRGIKRLDILQITHFDKDHVGGAAKIVRNIEIGRIIYPDYEGTRPEYFMFMEAIKEHGHAGAVTGVSSFSLGDAALTVYPAEDPEAFVSDEGEYDNEMSLVTRMEYGENVFLFCGDAEKKRLKQMCKSGADWKCDWIKLPHHGKYDKRLSEFLGLCSPGYAVATVSDEEPADSELTDELASLGIKYYDTLAGNVVTYSDGATITVSVPETS